MDEYIKRKAALAICEEEYREQLRILNYAGDSVAWNIGHAIKELPAADVAPVVHGRWVRDDDFFICAQCEAEMNKKNSLGVDNFKNYYPNCGAKMDGGDDDATNGNV